MVFMQPQRLIVPLFQRPYVWNQENQWEPLWNDVVRVTDRLLRRPGEKHYPHFLGAIVLQQVQGRTGGMQQRTIIDGQQRLTTLQLLLDALHAELLSVEFGVIDRHFVDDKRGTGVPRLWAYVSISPATGTVCTPEG